MTVGYTSIHDQVVSSNGDHLALSWCKAQMWIMWTSNPKASNSHRLGILWKVSRQEHSAKDTSNLHDVSFETNQRPIP